jgi:tRNA A-37 threonylcarbamoyl transferase component Bud32
MTFLPGENVGPYRIIEQLGQGGMATVFKAYHAGLDRYVAIKVMHPAFKQDPNFLARFQREARVVAKLDHPNIVPIYDYAEHNSNPYLVMKFVDGETLKARLSRGPLTRDEGLRIVDAMGKALAFAHVCGILHRDIKPSNILLCPDGAVYLADFGLARIAQAGESTLSSEMLLGTPHYISPEQARGERHLDAGTDIYSFGVVLYEMVVGRVPFNADTPFSIIHDHIYTPLPLPQKINPRVPDGVQRVLLKALAKERVDRFTTVEQLADAFLEAVSAPRSGPVRADAVDTLVGAPLPPAPPPMAGQGPGGEAVSAPQVQRPPIDAASAIPVKRKRSRTWLWVVGGLGLSLLCLFVLIGAAGKQAGGQVVPPVENSPGLPAAGEPRDPGVLAARATLAARPEDPTAHLAVAEAEVRAGFPLLAARDYRKAGDLFMRVGRVLQAAEAYLRAISNAGGPEKTDATVLDSAQRAAFLAGSEDPDGTLALLGGAVKAFPDWPPLPSLEAHALIAQGNMPRARGLIDAAIQRSPQDGLAQVVLAEWLRKSGDPRGARSAADAARATGTLAPWLSSFLDEVMKGA